MNLFSNSKATRHLDRGQASEQLAETYLTQQGLTVVSRNFHSRFGEIDLICTHQQTLIFVEVRFRSSKQFGGAIASVTQTKQRKIIKAAQFFLQTQAEYKNYFLRFDVVGIERNDKIEWIQGAFQAYE